jgi:DNA polymerase III delta prime subunit
MRDSEPDELDQSDDGNFPMFNERRETDAASLLIEAALAGTNTTAIRRALASTSPHVILITTPSAAWARALCTEVEHAYRHISTNAIVDRKKDGNQWLVDTMLARLTAGKHMVVCTPDPQLVHPNVLAAVDARLALPPVTSKLLRRAIRRLTGTPSRGLTEWDVAGLDFPVLQAALRPGSRATECLRRLRRSVEWAALLRPGAMNNTGPALEELPLSVQIGEWAEDMVDQLKEVAAGKLAPSELRHGVLAGPPGTGKTILAGAIAKSAGWTFQAASMGEWFNNSDGNLGGVTKAITAFFDNLLASDCIVGFVDEVDSLPSRSNLETRDLQWWGTVINLMLTQIDRLRASGKKILLLSATNHVTNLDPGLVRGGRLEQRIDVLPPRTPAEVLAVFVHYLKGEIDPNDLQGVEHFGLGATPATIAGWVRAARAMARRQKRPIESHDVMAAVAPPDCRSTEERAAVALHEAGHATIARVLGIGVEIVSIVADGAAGGVTRTRDPYSFPNWQELEDRVTVLLAGRAADSALGGKGAHAGAANDLEVATNLLVRGLFQWGLQDNLSFRNHVDGDVLQTVNSSLKRLLARATDLILEHQADVKCLAAALLEHRLLTGPQIEDILDSGGGIGADHSKVLPKVGSNGRARRRALATSGRGDVR